MNFADTEGQQWTPSFYPQVSPLNSNLTLRYDEGQLALESNKSLLLPFLFGSEELLEANLSFGGGGTDVGVKDLGGSPSSDTPVGTIISASSINFIIVYCFLFITGAVGNLSVFLSVGHELWRKRHRSRIKVLILHLSIADLFVIFFVIPIEVFWRVTIFWYGGDLLCKICQFFRGFGLYLSSNVIICISLDRFYVIVSPLKAIGGMRRVKNMLLLAWVTAVLFATPQSIVFSVRSHPIQPNLEQCATYYFKSIEDEFLYYMMSVSAMYFAPLTVILFTYVGVLIKVTRRSREHQTVTEFQRRILQQRISRSSGIQPTSGGTSEGLMISSRILLKRIFARETNGGGGTAVTTTNLTNGSGVTNVGGQGATTNVVINPNYRRGSQFLRMSDTASNINNRSRRQAFFLTMLIITVFVICWTPYVAMTLWYMLDWESAKIVDARVHEAFFTMAVSNSCLNPMIYGNYVRRFYYSCCAKRREALVISGDEHRSVTRRESCDVRQF